MHSENLLGQIHQCFPTKNRDIRNYSSLQLAYLGDAFYEILVRTIIVEQTNCPVKKLHTRTSSLVNASAQASAAVSLQEHLTEEELAVYRRGRNAKSATVAKHADVRDYRSATGLEALFGYLYLTGQSERAIQLLQVALLPSELFPQENPDKK